MKSPMIKSLSSLVVVGALAFATGGPALAQVSPQTLKSISIPNKVATPIGSLDFFDGVPSKATAIAVYDNLDRMRGTAVFLDNIGAVSMYAVRTGLADAGAKGANKIALFPQLLDSQTLVVTANTSTLYAYTFTDLSQDGPTVIEIPPGMLGFLDDAWQRFVGNMGVTGPDKGQGGKLPGVNYVGGSRQLRRRVPPASPPAMAGGGGSKNRATAGDTTDGPPCPGPLPLSRDLLVGPRRQARWLAFLLSSRLSAAAERTSRRTPRSGGSAEPITGTWRQGLLAVGG